MYILITYMYTYIYTKISARRLRGFEVPSSFRKLSCLLAPSKTLLLLHRSHLALKSAARAWFVATVALQSAARACFVATMALKSAARACFVATMALKSAARACFVATEALESAV